MALFLNRELSRPWDQVQGVIRRNFELIQIAFNQLAALIGKIAPVVHVTDAASLQIDLAQGNIFRLIAAGNRTIVRPVLHPTADQEFVIQHMAAGGSNRTLALGTGEDGFRFGSTITGLTATVSGKTDYIYCYYNALDRRCDVVNVVKGF